jgi:hypothetical protein
MVFQSFFCPYFPLAAGPVHLHVHELQVAGLFVLDPGSAVPAGANSRTEHHPG